MSDLETRPGPARVAVIYSPRAGSARRAHPSDLLRAAGMDVVDAAPVTILDEDPDVLIARWRGMGAQALVAAGGDGTVGAIGGLAARANLPLGILPLGTANDVARALGLPTQPAAAANVIARTLASGEERLIDAGEMVREGVASGGYFLHALTLGLNVEFARRATAAQQRERWGKLTYVASAIESLSSFTPLPVTLAVTGMEGSAEGATTSITAQIALLAALNLPIFGGRMELRAPTVREHDSLLDFFLIEAPERGGVVGVMAALEQLVDGLMLAAERGELDTRAGPVAFPGARWFRAGAVAITTSEPAQITVDGELHGTTPATVRIAAEPARVLAPSPKSSTQPTGI